MTAYCYEFKGVWKLVTQFNSIDKDLRVFSKLNGTQLNFMDLSVFSKFK